ncbi:uncharacterized protein N7529_000066 [Penicillium soppii]|uniref:uncharacterized protein n=1 Tax=Penicillium soppii TaxID=69789 RepID=UPI002546EC74|nr:uncharacterized protein N7529_000066 [Penicillium soppii]KAJ5881394.1 hypothetical protein N7529_000066 [Penicillium soppii]
MRFKPVHHVFQKGNRAHTRFDLHWDEEQIWVDVSQPVTFVLEATDGSAGDETTILPDCNTPDPLHIPHIPRREPQERCPDERIVDPHTSRVLENRLQVATSSPLSQLSEDGIVLSLREASLMRYFIHKIAPWADICDIHSHFSTEVPRRALKNSLVLKAILALSARHYAILAQDSDWEASAYHGECLKLLIAALNEAETHCDENMLIAVVILRIYEELENNTDQKFHLLGSNRLVNLVSRSASSGGVAEAYQPLQLDMQNYESSSMFQRHDDMAYANMIIYYCARILQLCCDTPERIVDRDTWRHISESVEDWSQTKPSTWQPIRYQAANMAADRPFPELWMISPPAVVGMQYYHSACIFLTLSDTPSHHMSDYEIALSKRAKELDTVFETLSNSKDL